MASSWTSAVRSRMCLAGLLLLLAPPGCPTCSCRTFVWPPEQPPPPPPPPPPSSSNDRRRLAQVGDTFCCVRPCESCDLLYANTEANKTKLCPSALPEQLTRCVFDDSQVDLGQALVISAMVLGLCVLGAILAIWHKRRHPNEKWKESGKFALKGLCMAALLAAIVFGALHGAFRPRRVDRATGVYLD